MKNNNILEITKKLIEFKTLSTNKSDIHAAFDFIKSVLKSTIECKIITNNGSCLLWASTQDFGNPDILLLCHIDVVSASDNDFIPQVSKKKNYWKRII